jgi:methionine sulfoxide reductase heme-binding subunit
MSTVIRDVPTRDAPARTRQLAFPRWLPRAAITLARLLPVLPLLAIGFMLVTAFMGAEGAMANLTEESPILLGNAALFSLAMSFAVTPIITVTGWRWHQILRRDFGLWTFGFASLDLIIAATTSPTGWRSGVAGQAFLAAATTATLLLIPLTVTSNRWSMRRFGSDWKRLHNLVYVVLALIAVHLLLLPGGAQEFGLFVVLFGPSLVLRVPPVRRRVIQTRESLLTRFARLRSEA